MPKTKKVPADDKARIVAITAHMPKGVRDQLKIISVEQNKTLTALIGESYNDLFAKYGKPKIAPSS